MTKREAIRANIASVFDVVDHLVASHQTLPTLILVYASIDILASLQRREGEGIRRSFVRWSDAFLQPEARLGCRSIDLYAARCAILHTLTPDADLVRKGEARPILYSWGSGDPIKLKEASRRLGYGYSALHIGELHAAVKEAAARFLDAVEADDGLRNQVERTAGRWLVDISTDALDALLSRTGGWPAV